MPECACEICQGACAQKPGWFLPEQIAPLAEHLGLTEQQLFDDYLIVNKIVSNGRDIPEDVHVLSPGIVGMRTGEDFAWATGTCIWFSQGKCQIHELKPFECAQYIHDEKPEDGDFLHCHTIPDAWKDHQEKIEKLVGYPLT